jgi:hypothetical protein
VASEYVLRTSLERHVINSRRSFADVIGDVRGRIGRPEPCGDHRRAGGIPVPAGLVSLAEFEIGWGPPGHDERCRTLRLLVDMPPASMELARFLPDSGVSCPATVLIQQIADGGTRLVYDSVASTVAAYQDDESTAVARGLDAEVLAMLRRVASDD